MGEKGLSGVKPFLAGKRKFAAISIIFVIGFMLLSFIVGVSSPNKTQNVVKQQETTKPDVAGIKTEELTPIPDTKQPSLTRLAQANLVRVVDGDTISVSINGKNETIRIIGIDTREVVDPRKTVECFGKEASDFAKRTLQVNKTLFLESDPTQGERDKYKRLLRYVWIEDGVVDFGKLMIAGGFASEYTYNSPYKYQNEYKQVEKEAREAKKSLWADGACVSAGEISPTTQQQAVTNTFGGDKDCSDFKVHDEAQTYFESKGGSSTNNVDKLDSDHDGIACESLP